MIARHSVHDGDKAGLHVVDEGRFVTLLGQSEKESKALGGPIRV
jgi:hypothetical protein